MDIFVRIYGKYTAITYRKKVKCGAEVPINNVL